MVTARGKQVAAPPQKQPLRAGWFRRNWVEIFSILLIVAAIWIVYWPSLNIISLSDQMDYLINTFGHYDTLDIFAHTYSYSRTRIVGPGDTACYRPAAFAWFALCKGVLGPDIRYQQAAGIALHCVVASLLLTVLTRICRLGNPEVQPEQSSSADRLRFFLLRWAPLMLTLFFCLNVSIVGMVIWTAIHPYMLFVALMLGVVHLLLRYGMFPALPRWQKLGLLAGIWLLALLAAFTYELGQFIGILAGSFLAVIVWRRGRRLRALLLQGLFLLVPIFYQTANVIDQKIHAGHFVPDISMREIVTKFFRTDTLWHAWRLLLYSVVQPLLPTNIRLELRSRIFILEPSWSAFHLDPWVFLAVIVVALGLALCALGLRGLWKKDQLLLRLLGTLLFIALGLYGGLTVAGRMNIRPGSTILSCNSYYSYKVLLLVTMGAAVLLAAGQSRHWRWLAGGMLVGLFLLTMMTASRTWKTSSLYAECLRQYSDPIHRINQFVCQHKGEKDFSVAFDDYGNPDIPMARGLYLPTIFFRQYENNYAPKYVLRYYYGHLQVKSGAEVARSLENRQPLFPEPVKIANRYHILYFNNSYTGFIYDEGSGMVAAVCSTKEEAERRTREVLVRLKQEMPGYW